MIRYTDNLDGIRGDMLHGFFEGWRCAPIVGKASGPSWLGAYFTN